jgi:hypothetical protein
MGMGKGGFDLHYKTHAPRKQAGASTVVTSPMCSCADLWHKPSNAASLASGRAATRYGVCLALPLGGVCSTWAGGVKGHERGAGGIPCRVAAVAQGRGTEVMGGALRSLVAGGCRWLERACVDRASRQVKPAISGKSLSLVLSSCLVGKPPRLSQKDEELASGLPDPSDPSRLGLDRRASPGQGERWTASGG